MANLSNDNKERLWALMTGFLGILGVIAGVGSINMGVKSDAVLYILAGIVAFINALYVVADIFQKYVKPTK